MEDILLQSALFYLKRGFSVIPIDFDGRVGGKDSAKKPLLFSTDRYLDAPPTEEEVRSWWAQWPWAAIGIPTGRVGGITVIDSEAEADLELFGLERIETPTAKSGRGGKHYYFKYEPDIGNRVKFAPFYDIRNDRGYIIAPPSSHESGGKYEWIVPLGSVELAPFPDNVKQIAKKTIKSSKAELDKLFQEGANKGSRNNSATEVLGPLLSRFPADQWSTVVWPILQLWNREYCHPPDDEDKLWKTFQSIGKSELSKRKLKESAKGMYELEPALEITKEGVVISFFSGDARIKFEFKDIEWGRNRALEADLNVLLLIGEFKPIEYGNRININSLSARRDMASELDRSFGKEYPWSLLLAGCSPLLKTYVTNRSQSKSVWDIEPRGERPENLLEPLLADKATNLLFGMGGGGKTYLCARLAISVASGIPLLGFMPSRKTSVLFLDYEDVEDEFRARIDELASGIQPSPNFADLAKIRYRNAGGIPIHDLIPRLKEEILQEEIGLLIVDSVGSACGSELERAESATGYWNDLNSLCVTTLSIAHVAKGGAENSDGEVNMKGQRAAFGSVFFHNGARNTWNLVAREEDSSILKTCLYHRKSNRGRKYGLIPVETDFSQLETKNIVTVTRGSESDWEEALPISKRIQKFLSGGLRSREDINREFEDVPKGTLRSALSRLVREKRVVNFGGEKGDYRLT